MGWFWGESVFLRPHVAWVLQRVFAKLCAVIALFLSCCFTMARTFTQEEFDALRRENAAQAATIIDLQARVAELVRRLQRKRLTNLLDHAIRVARSARLESDCRRSSW